MNAPSAFWRASWLLGVLLLTATARAGDLVVVMAPNAAPLTKDQVAAIYLGHSKDLYPLDLPEASPLRADFYKKAAHRDSGQIKELWARIIFTGQGQPPKQMADAAEVKKAVAANPRAVGYIDKADLDASVKVVLLLD